MGYEEIFREFGPYAAGLVIFASLLFTGILEIGRAAKRERDGLTAALRHERELRLEERASRKEAEERLDKTLEIVDEVTDLARKYESALRDAR